MRWIAALTLFVACAPAKQAPTPALAREPIGLRQNPCNVNDRVSCFTMCNAGDRESCFRYAILEHAEKRLLGLCDRGLGKACYHASLWSHDQTLVERARPLLAKDCDDGDGDACMELASLVRRDDDEVVRLNLKGRIAYARWCRDGDRFSCALLNDR